MKLSKRLKLLESKHRTTKEQKEQLQARCTGLISIVSDLLHNMQQVVEQHGEALSGVPHDVHSASVDEVRSYSDDITKALASSLSTITAPTMLTCVHCGKDAASESTHGTDAITGARSVSPGGGTMVVTGTTDNTDEATTATTATTATATTATTPNTATTATTATTPSTPTTSTTDTTDTTSTATTAVSNHETSTRPAASGVAASTDNARTHHQLQSLRSSTDNLRKTLEQERKQRSSLELEMTSLREQSEHFKAQSDEQILFLKLKLDAQKRQREENERVHGAMLKDHLNEINHMKQKTEKNVVSLQKSEEAKLLLQSQLDGNVAALDTKRTASLQMEVNRLETTSSDRASEAAEATERANQTTVALTEAIVELEKVRSLSEEHRVAYVTAQDMVKRLQTRLDAAAAQRGDAFSALDNVRSDYEDARKRNEKYEMGRKKRRGELVICTQELEKVTLESLEREKQVLELETALRNTENTVTKRLENKYRIDAMEQERMRQQEKESSGRERKRNEEMDRLRRDFQKKSTKARNMVEAKEREIRDMKSMVESLKVEVESGRPQERQILQFAQTQAKRESEQKRMKSKIATLEHALKQTSEQLELQNAQEKHLRTTLQRRVMLQGVNMEYLRNIVLRYMSLSSFRSERLQLVPALASLLDFSKTELAGLDGANRALVRSWWRAAKEQRKNALHQKKEHSSKQ